jgi:hypothetical protein
MREDILGPAEEEASDEDLAAADVNGQLVARLPLPVWSRIRMAGLEHALLIAAENGGLAAVNRLPGPADCGRAPPPPRED